MVASWLEGTDRGRYCYSQAIMTQTGFRREREETLLRLCWRDCHSRVSSMSPDSTSTTEPPRRRPLYPAWVTWMLAVAVVIWMMLWIYPASAIVRSQGSFPWRMFATLLFGSIALVYALSEPIRHRGRISLRAVFMFVAVASALTSLFGARWMEVRRQRDLVAEVRSLGGEVGYDVYVSSLSDSLVLAPGGWVLPPWVVESLGPDFFSDLMIVNFEPARIEDADFVRLDFTGMKQVMLSGQRITDQSSHHLARFDSIQYVDLSGTAVTDDGLRKLLRLPNLEGLSLRNTNITDETVKRLTDVRRLKVVRLEGADLVSTEAIQKLCASLPGALVFNDRSLPIKPDVSE